MGGAGYTGGELLRLLLNHENVEVAFVQSRSQVDQPVYSVHQDLLGVSELKFVDNLSAANSPLYDKNLRAIFLALPHGEARKFVENTQIPEQVRIIDLSHDFRITAHNSGAGRKFVYGLPEVRREEIKSAHDIANPGCFATCIQLALLPLARAKKLSSVAVTGITGASGAGVQLSPTSHFANRASNISAYKTLSHQHVAEVQETLRYLQGDEKPVIQFIPWRGDFTRGIFVSAMVGSVGTKDEILTLYKKYYEGHPFISVTGNAINLKSIVNTNRAVIEVNGDGPEVVIHCAIDNLLKGAAGQAAQNFNLMFGLPETTGLNLKGSAF